VVCLTDVQLSCVLRNCADVLIILFLAVIGTVMFLVFSYRYCVYTYISCVVVDFEANASHYEPHELVYVLRAYGQLNYVPPNSGSFFAAVERILMSKFSEFDPASMLEMLSSFVYIKRVPVTFLGHVFSPHFFMKIKGRCLSASLFTCALFYILNNRDLIVVKYEMKFFCLTC